MENNEYYSPQKSNINFLHNEPGAIVHEEHSALKVRLRYLSQVE